MQPTPPPSNPLAEIAAFVISGLLIIGAVILLALGKIDFPYATSMFTLAVGILAAILAYKAPSPAQQAQNTALVSQAMDALPGVLARIQQTPPPITIHNNLPPLPPSATVPAVPISAAAQPAPVQITPNPAFNATASGVAVQQVEFPERFAGDAPAV